MKWYLPKKGAEFAGKCTSVWAVIFFTVLTGITLLASLSGMDLAQVNGRFDTSCSCGRSGLSGVVGVRWIPVHHANVMARFIESCHLNFAYYNAHKKAIAHRLNLVHTSSGYEIVSRQHNLNNKTQCYRVVEYCPQALRMDSKLLYSGYSANMEEAACIGSSSPFLKYPKTYNPDWIIVAVFTRCQCLHSIPQCVL